MNAKKAAIISEAFDVFAIARDLQGRIKNAYGVEIDLDQSIEIIKVANISQILDCVSGIETDISHIASE